MSLGSSPYIAIYKYEDDVFTKLSNPSYLLQGNGNGCAFSPDGIHLAVCGNRPAYNQPSVIVYKRNGDSFAKVFDNANNPYATNTAFRGCCFSPSGTYLAVAYQHDSLTGTKRITIYKRSGDSFTRLSDPTDIPANYTVQDCDFSYDDTYLAMTLGNTSPYIVICKRSGDSFTSLPAPDVLPTGQTMACAFSPDGIYLSTGTITYKRNGDSFSILPDPDVLPAGGVTDCVFSPDGSYLAVTHNLSPFITIYNKEGDTFTKLPDPDSLPASGATGCAFSSDSRYLAVGYSGSSYLSLYKRDEGDQFNFHSFILPNGGL